MNFQCLLADLLGKCHKNEKGSIHLSGPLQAYRLPPAVAGRGRGGCDGVVSPIMHGPGRVRVQCSKGEEIEYGVFRSCFHSSPSH